MSCVFGGLGSALVRAVLSQVPLEVVVCAAIIWARKKARD